MRYFLIRADSVFSAPFYIRNLLDGEHFPNYQTNDPNGFLNSPMQVLKRSVKILAAPGAGSSTLCEEVPRIYLLLDAPVNTVKLSDKKAVFLDSQDQSLVR